MASPTLITSLIVQLVDRATAPLRRLTDNFAVLERAGKRASAAFKLTANMKHGADAVADFSRQAAGLVEKPIKKYMDFQEQISSVKAATFDLTQAMAPDQVAAMDAAMVNISKTARDLGATTQFSASQVAEGMDILAKNFSGSDLEKAKAIVEAMPGILAAAAASKESIETTADITTAAMNQFGLAAGDMGDIGDILVKTANSSATGLTDLGEALKYSGVSAKAAGLNLQTTAAFLGALGNAGKKGSQAGTGLASVLGNLQSGMKKQKSALAALGIDVKNKDGNLKPVLEILEELDKAADKKFGKGKGGVRRDRWLQALVGMGSDKETLAILMKQAGTGELRKMVDVNDNARDAAKNVAEEMGKNAAGAAKNLDSAMEELQLTIGEQLIPKVTELIKEVNRIVNAVSAWSREHPELVRGIGMVVGGLAAFGLVAAPVIKGVSALITVWGGLTYALGIVKTAFILARGAIVGGFRAITAAAAASPLGLITAIAMGALLIYEYWEPIKEFFSGLWDSVVAGFKVALDWIMGKIQWAYDTIVAVKEALLGIGYDDAKAEVADADLQPAVVASIQAMLQDQLAGLGGGFADLARQATGAGAPQAANGPPVATGAPLGGDKAALSSFAGELKITVDADGRVAKQELKTRGDPGFVVRANVGGQR